MKLKEKLTERLIEISIEKTVLLLLALGGISTTTIWAITKSISKHKFQIQLSIIISSFFALLFLELIIYFIIKKLKSKKLFIEGTKVTLTTQRGPVMSIGKYNFLNNKVLCSWNTDNNTIKHDWINQNQLMKYEPRPIILPISGGRRSNIY